MLAIPKSGPIARTTMAYVLAGGRGSRLMELTDRRAKPAVYFGCNSASSTSRCPTRSIPASAASASPRSTSRTA